MAAQAAARDSLKARVWQGLVRGKIINQAAMVAALWPSAAAFEAMARNAKPAER